MDKVLKEMKSSDYYKIVAHVSEIVEKAGFNPDKDVKIMDSETPENWKMVFQKHDTSLEEMQDIKKQLGGNFDLKVTPKDKSVLLINIEAPANEFIRLKDKNPKQTGDMFRGPEQ